MEYYWGYQMKEDEMPGSEASLGDENVYISQGKRPLGRPTC
jgi:hypothetical protein